MTNNEVTRSVLNTRQINSLLKLKQRADSAQHTAQTIKVSNAQLQAIRTAYLAIVASNAPIPEEIKQHAKNLGII